jgi:hypothetical protein
MAGYPSSSNTYIPSHEASGKLQIEYSRNPKKFSLNQYVHYVPVTQDTGYYLNITAEQAARMADSSGRDKDWHDGSEAPTGDAEAESFSWSPYTTARKAYPVQLGNKAVQQASWDILATHSRIQAQRAMTYRTQLAVTQLVTSGNWGANTSTATALAGGTLAASTSTTMYIKEAIQKVGIAIEQATLSTVDPDKDIVMVMNPNTATQISRSQEMVDFLKQSPAALGQVMGNIPGQTGKRGLPDYLYGMGVVIENAVKITSKPLAASVTRDYILPDGDIIFCSRPEGFEGSAGVPIFSTITIFVYEDMTVESKADPDNRRTSVRIVDDFQAVVTAPASGYLLTGCV